MIEKTHPRGVKVVIDLSEVDKFHASPYHGKRGTLVSTYGHHDVEVQGGKRATFWGYFVRLEDGQLIGFSRHHMRLRGIEPPTSRGTLDIKTSWATCPWKPTFQK